MTTSYILIGIFGAVALNPDWGFFRENKRIRLLHKIGGRLLTALSWTCCVLGFTTMESNMAISFAFTAPLLFFGYYVLL